MWHSYEKKGKIKTLRTIVTGVNAHSGSSDKTLLIQVLQTRLGKDILAMILEQEFFLWGVWIMFRVSTAHCNGRHLFFKNLALVFL